MKLKTLLMVLLGSIIVGSLMLQSTAFADVGAGYSGSWYNQDQSGHGFNIEYGETNDGTGYMVAYWYIYDTDGNPIFLVGVSQPEGNTVEIAFEAPYGMVYGSFDPDAVIREDGGVGTFTFVDSDNGEFNYVPSTWMVETYGVSVITVPIVKLFNVAHPNPEMIEVLLERQGIQGEKGDTGPMGPKGDTGPQGAAGSQGIQGPIGPAGQDGSDHGTEIAALQSQVNGLLSLLDGVGRGVDPNTGQDTLQFSDMNVQIVNGTGTTDGVTTGTGNLIIGYNQMRGDAQCPDGIDCDRRTGSHMLVIGGLNNYTFYGGMVVGEGNETSAPYASISGGGGNTANGHAASISGGISNTASGHAASISGGFSNIASGTGASISGGQESVASGSASSVSAGYMNQASAEFASVTGGDSNIASGVSASISGGDRNSASGDYSSVSGGSANTASGLVASITGGGGNTASGQESSISSGSGSIASGYSASVSGGNSNMASGDSASVSGGSANTASGVESSVSGGQHKNAVTDFCVVGDSGDDC